MNPVVRQILDNIGRLGRELEKSQPNPLQTNGGTMSNERTVSVKGEVSRIFSPLPGFIPVMLALLALSAMSSLLVLLQLLSKDQVTAQILR